jgi:hypothetical protein
VTAAPSDAEGAATVDTNGIDEPRDEDGTVDDGAGTPGGRPRTGRVVAVAVLIALAVVFVVGGWSRISAPFGQSDEGLNGAVWGAGSRSFRAQGPIESALGGRHLDGQAYATHPPVLVSATTLSEWVLGEHRWTTRLPAVVASLASIGLAYLLLSSRLDPLGAAAATLAGLGTPMLLVYGPMLDTPVLGLPWLLAVLVCWQRVLDDRAPPTLVLAAVAAGAGLTGWQAALGAALAGGHLLVWGGRGDPARRRAGWPLLGGAIGGVAGSLAWGAWVYGDLGRLRDKFVLRSGGDIGWLESVDYQVGWIVTLLGLGIVGLVGCLLALRSPRWRPLAAMSLTVVVLYGLLFHGAAGSHYYWNYAVLAPTTVGFGFLAGEVEAAARREGRSPRAVSVVLIVAAAASCLFHVLRPTTAETAIDRAAVGGELVADAAYPVDQTELVWIGGLVVPEPWLAYESGRTPRPFTDVASFRTLADAHPEHLVLVVGPCFDDDALCAAVRGDADPEYQLLPAAELADRLAPSAPTD